MKTKPIKEIFNELFSHLERLETQNEAILQFLKEKKRVTDKQLAPYLEQAGNASNVRWRAARVRIEHLLSEDEDKEKETVVSKAPEIAKAEQAEAHKTNDSRNLPADDQTADDKTTEDGKSVAAPREKQAEVRKPSLNSTPSPKADAPTQSKDEQSAERKEEASHPTEMTEEMAQREGAEPPPELTPENKSGEKTTGEKEAA
jgi:hypothetical protein